MEQMMTLYSPEQILSKKSERKYLGLGAWKKTYSFKYVTECGFDVGELDPIILLKTLLLTGSTKRMLEWVSRNTEILFDNTKGDRKVIYSDDGDYGLSKFFVMLDLFPFEYMEFYISRYLTAFLGGKNPNGYVEMDFVYKPGTTIVLNSLPKAKTEISLHIEMANICLQEQIAKNLQISLADEYLTTYFAIKPKIAFEWIGLDDLISYMRRGDKIINHSQYNEVYRALFDIPVTMPAAPIPCSGCFIQKHNGMKCVVHGRVKMRVVIPTATVVKKHSLKPVVKPSAPPLQDDIQPTAPPQESLWIPEYDLSPLKNT